MIKAVNQLVNYDCNSRCKMCSIWTMERNPNQMSAEQFAEFYAKEDFRYVEELSVSGGEPTLREDLISVVKAIAGKLPQLKTVFLNTNCSFPGRAIDFTRAISEIVPQLFIVVPLEGEKEMHNRIRGLPNSYDDVVTVLSRLNEMKAKNVRAIISTTLLKSNCTAESLSHATSVARQFNAGHTIHPVNTSQTFYANEKVRGLELSQEQKQLIVDHGKNEKPDDPFLKELAKHFSNQATVMGDRQGNIKCLAGNISAFIKSDGTMYPCIYSKRIIGDRHHGLYKTKYQLGTGGMEPCPCCTECQVYPMLNFARFAGIYKTATNPPALF